MKARTLLTAAGVLAIGFATTACESDYKESKSDPAVQAEQKRSMHADVDATVTAFRAKDATLNRFFDNAHGYAIFPKIAKGGAGIGGAYGEGQVFERGALVGDTTMKQATIGLQLGGQQYSEIIFFQDATRLQEFKDGKFEFSAQATAVAAKEGAAANADYAQGVAIFTLPRGGLMGEASVGGQKFTYSPVSR